MTGTAHAPLQADTRLTAAAMRALRNVGLSATFPRMAVWIVLAQSNQPIYVVDIQRVLIEQGFDTPLSSTYAALKRLTAAGLVTGQLFQGNKTRYRLTHHPTRSRLTCIDTGAEHWMDDPAITRYIASLCKKHGFELRDYTLSIQARPAADLASRP